MFAGWLALFRQDWASARSHAATTITLGQEYGFSQIIAEGVFIQGRALLAQGQAEEGVTAMLEGLAALKAVGVQCGFAMILVLLADGYATIGWFAEGLGAVMEGLAWSTRSGEYWWNAELHRLRGALLLAQGTAQRHEVEACFQKALVRARQQHAQLFELRAATSLAQLLYSQNKCQEAYHLLTSVYHRFTEGLETVDLQVARGLLEELRES